MISFSEITAGLFRYFDIVKCMYFYQCVLPCVLNEITAHNLSPMKTTTPEPNEHKYKRTQIY